MIAHGPNRPVHRRQILGAFSDPMTPSLRRSLLLAFSLALVSFPFARAAEPAPASLAWWQEAKLGLFLHWGIYSLAAGEWRGQESSTIPPWEGKNFSEFLMLQGRIPIREYEAFARGFNPVRFDADAWVRAARDAGLRYIVFTAKHHDGFALYQSASDRFNIVDHTPFKRDPLRELADACARHDMKLGIYYSLGRDWHDPDVPTNWPTRGGRSNTWDFPNEDAKVFSRYFKRKVLPQVRELLTGYGPVGVMWFDTPELISKDESRELRALVRELQPACIVNDRVGNKLGDFQTAEQNIPDLTNNAPWESCITMSRNWGFNRHDRAWKSPETIVRLLTDTVAKGGNLLLNVGPRPEGDFTPGNIERLAALGRWMQVNGAAIYGSKPWHQFAEDAPPAVPKQTSPPAKPGAATDADTVHDATPKDLEPDIRFTRGADGSIYLIARSWREDVVRSRALGAKSPNAPRLAAVSLLGSTTTPVWKQADDALEITFPPKRPGEIPVWVFKLTPALKVTHPDSNPLREALRPLPETAIFKMDGYYLWDPSLIKVGDTYHLFASRWPVTPERMEGWKKSHVIRATSKSLFGPYNFQEVVLSPAKHPWATQAVHNPKVMKTGGGGFLIYHLGIPQWKTGFAYADSIEGPWTPVPHPVLATNNPAIIERADGSAYAVGKFKPKPARDGEWDACMQSFEADNINGPYKVLGGPGNRLPNNFELEDPTLWWADNRYNVICTDWEAKVTGIQKAVVYYTSKNGVDYELYSRIPVWSQNDPVPLANGKSLKISGVERPQVFQNEKGAVIALLASVYPADREKDSTFIIIRPINLSVSTIP